VNDVILLKSCVILPRCNVPNFVIPKLKFYIMDNNSNRNLPVRQEDDDGSKHFNGYPTYPANEDIYRKFKKEKNIDPEDVSKIKEPKESENLKVHNSRNVEADSLGSDLDIPGSELDDNDEAIGSEDEENNYYSIGGDEHNDLDEDRGAIGLNQ
jgi:hypothetical protein